METPQEIMKPRDEIINRITKKGYATLKELKEIKNTTRQNIQYHIKILCENNKIQPQIKGTGLKDEEIFYTLFNDEHPTNVLNLIGRMCSVDVATSEKAIIEFVNLYVKRTEMSVNIWREKVIQKEEKQRQYSYDYHLKLYGSKGRPDLLERFSSIEQYQKYLEDQGKEIFEQNTSLKEEELKKEVQNAKQNAIRLAHALICGAFPKEKAAFSLTCKNEDGSYNLEKYTP